MPKKINAPFFIVTEPKKLKVAIFYDRVIKFGGAERVLLALHEIWPEAPLYAVFYNKEKAKWSDVFNVIPSWLSRFNFLNNIPEFLLPFIPYVIESFNLDRYDVVISVTSAEGKAILTKPDTLHICYCLTPTRYLWSGYRDYLKEPGYGKMNGLIRFAMRVFFPSFRMKDYYYSKRPDHYLAISDNVRKRIRKYYREESEIIFPPLFSGIFTPKRTDTPGDYYLVVSRLVPYKKIDYVIDAFNTTGEKLLIIGRGLDERRLKKMAAGNIEFIGRDLTDDKLCCYYQNCRALIFPGEEDFGLTAVEAQACGRPVIALAKGGVAESIIAGKSGLLYKNADTKSLLEALGKFSRMRFSPSACRRSALRFSKAIFKKKFKEQVERHLYTYRNI